MGTIPSPSFIGHHDNGLGGRFVGLDKLIIALSILESSVVISWLLSQSVRQSTSKPLLIKVLCNLKWLNLSSMYRLCPSDAF